MSLNGLDSPNVKEAHDAAAAEPGGWFLLKYISRDEVELLGRGNGGIVEIRNAIASYEEDSPLFGFLRYRRRNVVIKYVPESCSRLVQARVTVHFGAVTERFSPHDTTFSINTSKELRDTTLSAACSLHTASGSTSSSTSSLRRRRLMEIAEEAEEDNRTKRQSTVPEERPPTAKTTTSITGAQPSAPPEISLPKLPGLPNLPSSTTFNSMTTYSDSLETFPPPPREPYVQSPSPTKSIDEPRKSSQSTRPDLFDNSSYGSYGKPKIKLGPRPSLDAGRPHTTAATSKYRPISTLPVGLKIFSRGSKKERERPLSHYPSDGPNMSLSPDTHTESTQTRPHTSGGRPTTSSGVSVKSMTPTINTPKLPGMTPEKARLMKAMELRKKQMSAPAPPPLPVPALTSSIDSPISIDGPISPVESSDQGLQDPSKDIQDTLAMLNEMAEKNDGFAIPSDASSALRTDESDATRSDSFPSPIGPSENAESTRASSISGSTDETVQEARDKENYMDGEVVHAEAHLLISRHEEQVDAENEVEEENQSSKGDEVESAPRIQIEESEDVQTTEEKPRNPSELPTEAVIEESPLLDEPVHIATTSMNPDISEVDAASYISTETEHQTISSEPAIEAVEEAKAITEAEPEPQPTSTAPERNGARNWKVPRSKFSTHDLKAAARIPVKPIPRSKFSIQELQPTADLHVDIPKESLRPSNSEASLNVSKSPGAVSVDSKRSSVEGNQETEDSSETKKRKGLEPIRTDLDADRSGGNSDANFSSDDDLMDELQSAVFQEAKPVTVPKSPMSPVFPSPKKAESGTSRFGRAFSNPLKKDRPESQYLPTPPIPRPESSRSVSAGAAYLNRISQQSAKPTPKKVNVGSGISQRIKALEKLSSLSPEAAANPASTGPTPGTSPSFFSVRKSGVRPVSRSPSIADRANSFTKNPSPNESRESSPENIKIRARSGSLHNRLEAFNTSPVPALRPTSSRPESVSVTARIVRDPNQPFPQKPEAGTDPMDYKPLTLTNSPLVIEHQEAISSPPKEKETLLERRLSTSSKKTDTKERRSSISIVKDLINERRSSFAERRRPTTIETSVSSPVVLSPSRPPSIHATSPKNRRPMSISSRHSREYSESFSPPPTAGSTSSNSDEKAEKKSNRASRMLRQMSSSLSAGRKTLAHVISPTVREESEPPNSPSFASSSHPSISATPTTTSIGEVNVQFPDTLLWKRRSMALDSQGLLIISPALTLHGNPKDKANLGATRRFHLSEFRTPVIPDIEIQEMPNSVVLKFIEGSELQIACEDRAGQKSVLKFLQEAHRQWAAYGQ